VKRRTLTAGLAAASSLGLVGCGTAPQAQRQYRFDAGWQLLPTEAFRGKQDDIHFVDASTGWYVNGEGKVYGSADGGQRWQLLASQPGTYFRAVGFVDPQLGFAANIGTDYFPGVTDSVPLYRSTSGGNTWAPVPLSGPPVKGLCAIDVLHTRFVNAGVLGQRTVIHAAGRVGGPAVLLRSLDAGGTWAQVPLPPSVGMVQDVLFFDAGTGLLFAGTDGDVARSHAQILLTQDGGTSWREVYRSQRPFELMWKGSFPTRDTGFATVQSYDPNPQVTQRWVVKSTDGGRSWAELPLVNDHRVREFGVGFVTPLLGWVGTSTGGFETRDGGLTWASVAMGRAVNKIRVLTTDTGFVAYAIGSQVHKLVGQLA
jgi:photosystem II stability/assembly factor-like uncharacterized protein